MHAVISWLLILPASVAAAPQSGGAAADTVVVCPQPLLASLRPWLDHRTAQGHRIALVRDTSSPAKIRAAIRRVAEGGKLRFVVLVGDDEPSAATDARVKARSLPSYKAQSQIVVRYGSEPEIATDNWYADLDGDNVPELAVGRLTADSPRQLDVIVEKILAYERATDVGTWRRQVNFVAGVGGFGVVVDSVIEMAAKKFITDGIPAGYNTSMTYGSWRSPYCPDPRHFHQTTLGRLNEGCLFWVYLGHGQRTLLDRVRAGGRTYHILGRHDVPKLRCTNGAPIAIFLACYAGAFDQPEDCLAEEMLRSRGAPVAVVCGSRVTMPYAMAVMGTCLLRECFHDRRHTLGEVLLHAKRRMVAEEDKSANRRMLDTLAAALSPEPKKLAQERAEHLLLFNLIGDPLLRLRHPEPVKLNVPTYGTAGERLELAGVCTVDGSCTIELVCRRDRLTFTPPPRPRFQPAGPVVEAVNDVYRRANDTRFTALRLDVAGGRFQTQLQIPTEARGPSHVRVYIRGKGKFALGAADVYIRPPMVEETGENR